MAELVHRDSQAAIYRLALPTPYPVGDVNCYLIQGAEPGLIDAGCDTDSSRRALEQQLAELGLASTALRTVAITHHHADHMGGAAALHRAGAAIALSHRSVEQWQPDPTASDVMYRFLLGLGTPAALVEVWRRYEEVALAGAFDARAVFGDAHSVEDGASVALAGCSWQVVATPGHALDHVCYLDPQRGIAFTGDHLLADITPNPVLTFDAEQGYRRRRSLLDYIASLHRLAGLRPQLALGGHGLPVTDPMALIAYNLAFIERRSRDYLQAMAPGESVPVFELGRRIFGDRDATNMFLATSETVAYLDLLQEQGAIDVVERDGIRCVRRARA